MEGLYSRDLDYLVGTSPQRVHQTSLSQATTPDIDTIQLVYGLAAAFFRRCLCDRIEKSEANVGPVECRCRFPDIFAVECWFRWCHG